MAGESPTLQRWGVKSATFTFNSVTYEMANGSAGVMGETKDALEVTSLTDSIKRFITGALKEQDEFTLTLYLKSTGNLTVDTSPAAASITATLENGVDADATVTVSFQKLIVTKVSPPSLDASGDRKATVDVTFRPDGTVAAG